MRHESISLFSTNPPLKSLIIKTHIQYGRYKHKDNYYNRNLPQNPKKKISSSSKLTQNIPKFQEKKKTKPKPKEKEQVMITRTNQSKVSTVPHPFFLSLPIKTLHPPKTKQIIPNQRSQPQRAREVLRPPQIPTRGAAAEPDV